uniref:Uncharacterized protein n=1 Tax=Glossina palpalis gambiensis TaxID=67801 RepID=A0A1B0BRS0_9MUSC
MTTTSACCYFRYIIVPHTTPSYVHKYINIYIHTLLIMSVDSERHIQLFLFCLSNVYCILITPNVDLFSFYLCCLNLLTCYVRHIIIGQFKHTRHTRCLIASTTQYSKSGALSQNSLDHLTRTTYRRMRERIASLYNVCIEYANIMGIILKTKSRISTKKFIDRVKSETSTAEINRDFDVERKQ